MIPKQTEFILYCQGKLLQFVLKNLELMHPKFQEITKIVIIWDILNYSGLKWGFKGHRVRECRAAT